jgi:uncharacterized damage-inducible protein DinB
VERDLLVLRLAAAPTLLRAVTGGSSPEQAWTPPRPGEWSLGEVARHLAQGDRDIFLPRLRRMVSEDRPVFGGGAAQAGELTDLPTLLDDFEAARRAAVSILRALDDAAWSRPGVSPSRGPLTIAEYARTMGEHDLEHLRQIQDVRAALGLLPRRAEAHLALPIGEIVAAIGTTPERIRAVTGGLSPDRLRQRPAPAEWSMKEVMAHLLKVERDVFLPRLRRTATEERPAFERFDPDAWAAERDHREGSFDEDWQGFVAARRETVALLQALPPGAEQRIGLSAFFGPVSLAAYATHVVDHDLEHLAQLAAGRAVTEAGAG